jgi:hypothetical protein
MNRMQQTWAWARRWSPWLWPATILLSAAGIAVIFFAGVAAPARPFITLWFLLLCPGMALVRLLRVEGIATQLTLAIALSLVLDSLVAGVMVYTGTWAPAAGLIILIVISVFGSLLQAVSARHMQVSAEDTV